MNRLLMILLFSPLAAFAADWRYDGGAAASSAGETTMSATESSMAMPSPGPAPAGAPGNNMTMAKVREAAGEPETVHDAVGEPPITRWQYPDYVVYFEHDRVITSVAGHW